ncbi:MAG TPA: hypothetical protein VGX23_16275 [Actinocrinis sp.]|nr:hypothetical protein [Actinocrinis sp.]
MTRYSYDATDRALIASWATGRGDLAHTVARFPPDSTGNEALDIAAALAALSTALWRSYTHPAVAAGDPEAVDTEAWRRAESRAAFAMVPDWVARPNLPAADGSLLMAYDRVEENAHLVGRALHAVGDPELTESVAAEVEVEIAAVQSAELGDLGGRAQQAVLLTRADASPVQVAAAHELLAADPLGTIEVFTDLDPTAAAVAAAHWLGAAAEVAADRAGIDLSQVVAEADDIESLCVQTPTLVLERLSIGESPRAIVIDLIEDAMHVAEGLLRDPGEIVARVAEINQQAAELGELGEEVRQSMLTEFRATALDPARPALDLLEDLLGGIRGCWLLFHEHAEFVEGLADDEDEGDEAEGGAGTLAQELEDDSALAEESERIDAEFLAEVRAAAQAGSFLL